MAIVKRSKNGEEKKVNGMLPNVGGKMMEIKGKIEFVAMLRKEVHGSRIFTVPKGLARESMVVGKEYKIVVKEV